MSPASLHYGHIFHELLTRLHSFLSASGPFVVVVVHPLAGGRAEAKAGAGTGAEAWSASFFFAST